MFDTQDLGLIAALQLHGVPPSTTHFSKRRLVYAYEDTPELARLRQAYYSGRLQGSLTAYNALLRALSIQIKEAR